MAAPASKRLRCIQRSVDRHWVGDGFPVRTLLAYPNLGSVIDPFLLLDYAGPAEFPPTEARLGVGEHPHRGFETVTIAFKGKIAHRDSAGNGGVIGPGEVQWMTAGNGVLHNEFHEEGFARQGGVLHMIQIWVNLPREHKRVAPKYQALTGDTIRSATLPEDKGVVRVISGAFEDARGPAETFSPAHVLDLRLKPAAQVRLPTPKDYNTALLVLEGELKANGSRAVSGEFILFKNDGDEVLVESLTDATVVFLSGAPIEEPLVHYGPFVMNSVDEINEAVDDFNSGRFGHLSD